MPIAECIRPAEEWRSAMPVEYTAFFEVAGDIKIKAFERVDIDDQVEAEVRLCSEITILILRIKILMDCFHRSPRRAVSGPGSVAEQLKVTRNAVYKQIESFGLDITDFSGADDFASTHCKKRSSTRRYRPHPELGER